MKYEIGQWVRSRQVGSKEPFVGHVAQRFSDGTYVIRDAERRRWLRGDEDLSSVESQNG